MICDASPANRMARTKSRITDGITGNRHRRIGHRKCPRYAVPCISQGEQKIFQCPDPARYFCRFSRPPEPRAMLGGMFGRQHLDTRSISHAGFPPRSHFFVWDLNISRFPPSDRRCPQVLSNPPAQELIPSETAQTSTFRSRSSQSYVASGQWLLSFSCFLCALDSLFLM
jgi:hypothetical protein